jgi:hypothetical protein
VDGWWIVGIPEVEDCGPYSVRADAESDRRGMERLFKYGDRPGYVTTDKQQ